MLKKAAYSKQAAKISLENIAWVIRGIPHCIPVLIALEMVILVREEAKQGILSMFCCWTVSTVWLLIYCLLLCKRSFSIQVQKHKFLSWGIEKSTWYFWLFSSDHIFQGWGWGRGVFMQWNNRLCFWFLFVAYTHYIVLKCKALVTVLRLDLQK